MPPAFLIRFCAVCRVFLLQSLNDLHLVLGLTLQDVCTRHRYFIFSLGIVLDDLALHDPKLAELPG